MAWSQRRQRPCSICMVRRGGRRSRSGRPPLPHTRSARRTPVRDTRHDGITAPMANRWFLAIAAVGGLGCGNGTPPPRPPETVPATTAEYQKPDPAALAAAAATAPPANDYPASRRDEVVEQIHGVAVADPYRWLEDPSKPEVQAWMTAQDSYARAH